MTKTLPKTNLHAIFATDRSKEEDGVWIPVNAFQGLEIKIRRLKSDAVMKAFEKKMAENYGEGEFRKKQSEASKDTKIGEEVLILQLSCALIDWKGLLDTDADIEDGEEYPEIPYSEELCLTLLQMRDFREFVYQHASDRDAFREKNDGDAEKN